MTLRDLCDGDSIEPVAVRVRVRQAKVKTTDGAYRLG